MDDMALPHGKTCSDCVHIQRCIALGVTRFEAVECDWSPSRFRDRSEARKGLETRINDPQGPSSDNSTG